MWHKQNKTKAVILWRNYYIFIRVILVSLRDYNINILRGGYFSNCVVMCVFSHFISFNVYKVLISFVSLLILVHLVKLDENVKVCLGN